MPKQILSEDDNDDPATPPKPKELKPSRPIGPKTRPPLASKPRKLRPSRPIGPKNESLVPAGSYDTESSGPVELSSTLMATARDPGLASNMLPVTLSPATSTSSTEPAALHLLRLYRHGGKALTQRKQQAFRLLDLPLEIRLMIYKELERTLSQYSNYKICHGAEVNPRTSFVHWKRTKWYHVDFLKVPSSDIWAFAQTCQTIRKEVLPLAWSMLALTFANFDVEYQPKMPSLAPIPVQWRHVCELSIDIKNEGSCIDLAKVLVDKLDGAHALQAFTIRCCRWRNGVRQPCSITFVNAMRDVWPKIHARAVMQLQTIWSSTEQTLGFKGESQVQNTDCGTPLTRLIRSGTCTPHWARRRA